MNSWFHAAGASAELISIARFVDAHNFATHSGAYGASFRLTGVDPEARSAEELADTSARVLQALRLIPDDCSVYQILIRRRGCDLEPSRYPDCETERRRREHLESRPLSTIELYWTLCIHPPKGKRAPKEHQQDAAAMLRKLRGVVTTLKHHFADFGIEQLDADGIARLYGYLATLEPELACSRLRSPHRVDRQLARVAVEWRRGGLKIGKRHVRVFSLVQRPKATAPNLFGAFFALQADFALVLELRRMSLDATRKEVAGHQKFLDFFREKWLSVVAHVGSHQPIPKTAFTKASEGAVDGLAGIVDDVQNKGMGYARFSLIGLLHSREDEELNDQMAQVHRIVGRSEAGVIEEEYGALSAYCSLFPAAASGSVSTNVRRAWIREDHLANLSLVYAPYTGERWSETLEAESLATFESRQGTPFHFDPYSDGVRGMLVTGSPGRGKSFWCNFAVDRQAKYGGFIFIFDVGGSFESTVLHHGGSIVRFGLGGPRLNPFALPTTDENIDFVYRLIRLLLTKSGAVLAPTQEIELVQRVRAMYSLPPEVRRLKSLVLAPQLQPYLARWIEGGIYGRIFDNVEDELRTSHITVFDFQEVSGEEHRDLMEPLLVWLRWRTQSITHDPAHLGVPKLEIYDECWRHFQDPAMVAMMINTAKTARKHLGGIILATQEAGDVGEHANLIRNACPDTLFLGGPFAREAYREVFRLHDRQLDIISELQLGESLLVRPGYSKVLVTSVDEESKWRYTTRAKDRKRRDDAIKQFGREHAFAHLAGNGNNQKGANL